MSDRKVFCDGQYLEAHKTSCRGACQQLDASVEEKLGPKAGYPNAEEVRPLFRFKVENSWLTPTRPAHILLASYQWHEYALQVTGVASPLASRQQALAHTSSQHTNGTC
eukprot:scaffold227678_cov12-Prasinocladus_malaysianus.AAC.1